MKVLKSLKIIDLIVSIFFIFLFFLNFGITSNYEYGLGELIQIIVSLPVVFLLIVSLILTIISLIQKKYLYCFSIISQSLKIIAYLLHYIIIKNVLHIIFKVNYIICIPIYALFILIIFVIHYICFSKKVELQ